MSSAGCQASPPFLWGDGRSTLNFFTKTASAECASGLPRNFNWAAHDNLAVALEKLGRYDEAIAQMQLKEKLNPGQYTTTPKPRHVLHAHGESRSGD